MFSDPVGVAVSLQTGLIYSSDSIGIFEKFKSGEDLIFGSAEFAPPLEERRGLAEVQTLCRP